MGELLRFQPKTEQSPHGGLPSFSHEQTKTVDFDRIDTSLLDAEASQDSVREWPEHSPDDIPRTPDFLEHYSYRLRQLGFALDAVRDAVENDIDAASWCYYKVEVDTAKTISIYQQKSQRTGELEDEVWGSAQNLGITLEAFNSAMYPPEKEVRDNRHPDEELEVLAPDPDALHGAKMGKEAIGDTLELASDMGILAHLGLAS